MTLKEQLPELPEGFPAPGSRWKHYKNETIYIVVGPVWNTDTENWDVLYKPSGKYRPPIFSRSFLSWSDILPMNVPRFQAQ